MSTDAMELPLAMSETERATSDEIHKANDQLPPVICYRDPADVRTIRRQSLLIIFAFVITAIAVVGVVYKSIQRPDRIVVDMSSGRTVMINDKELVYPGRSVAELAFEREVQRWVLTGGA